MSGIIYKRHIFSTIFPLIMTSVLCAAPADTKYDIHTIFSIMTVMHLLLAVYHEVHTFILPSQYQHYIL